MIFSIRTRHLTRLFLCCLISILPCVLADETRGDSGSLVDASGLLLTKKLIGEEHTDSSEDRGDSAEDTPDSASDLSTLAAEASSDDSVDPADPAGDSGDDVDSNLVSLEPELDPSPLDLAASDGDSAVQNSENSADSRSADASSEIDGKEPSVSEDEDPSVHASASEEEASSDDYNIPVVVDPTVEKHLRFFNTSIRDRFEQWLVRFSRYRPLVETIFAEFDLPSDLVNLSLVESGFNPYAYSRAKATGPWQFMKATGKIYGLRIDNYVDERRDPIKSTVAAARYLRDLYDLFGTWPLAMAAYNAGEGKVLRALRKVQGETFSDISKTRLIRRETKQYVPRIMAATIIARNPNVYGFTHDPAPPHEFDEVIVNRPMHFHAISNISGIPYEELRLLNPELRRNATPPGDSAYHLKVPVGTGMKVMDVLDRIPTYKFTAYSERTPLAKKGSSLWYRVRPGDTLEKVSRQFRVPIQTLKKRNNLSGSLIKVGDMLSIRPSHSDQTRLAKKGSALRYRVRPGDTLEKVSKRFRVPIQTLKQRNNLSSSLIKIGDLLIIRR
ncbi:MAG: LysM peptidoglycan-binding domain-containing protein [Nitrospira sp.]|nr:LysM peptidoglycan-binding domain-containing protein [Nitrospira sp.]